MTWKLPKWSKRKLRHWQTGWGHWWWGWLVYLFLYLTTFFGTQKEHTQGTYISFHIFQLPTFASAVFKPALSVNLNDNDRTMCLQGNSSTVLFAAKLRRLCIPHFIVNECSWAQTIEVKFPFSTLIFFYGSRQTPWAKVTSKQPWTCSSTWPRSCFICLSCCDPLISLPYITILFDSRLKIHKIEIIIIKNTNPTRWLEGILTTVQ